VPTRVFMVIECILSGDATHVKHFIENHSELHRNIFVCPFHNLHIKKKKSWFAEGGFSLMGRFIIEAHEAECLFCISISQWPIKF